MDRNAHKRLTAQARAALLNIGTNRQGAKIGEHTPENVAQELEAAGFIGPGRGMTMRGTIARERLADESMSELFG